MVKRVIAVAAIALATMAAVKDGRVLRDTGLTGRCTVVQTAADGTVLDACSSGKLEGFPSLTGHGCTQLGLYRSYEFWHCPAGLVGDQASR